LSVVLENRREGDGVGQTLRSSGLLHVEASLTSRLAKVRRQVVHVAPSWRLRRVQAEDRRVDAIGCIGPFYPRIIVFYVLGPRGIVVIYSFP
jgi:hypothetical protein